MHVHARLTLGASILFIAALALLSASFAIVTPSPDLSSKVGRHLVAGALANVSVAILLATLALVPIRRGEPWAFWLYVIVAAVYGIPVLVLDATHVAPSRLVVTLLPQMLGLVTMSVGLAIAGSAIFRKHRGSEATVPRSMLERR
jgi:hypothetical protein